MDLDLPPNEQPIFNRITVKLRQKKVEFLDFRTGTIISLPIPRDRESRRNFLIDMFYEASKRVYMFAPAITMRGIYECIPRNLWVQNFTEQESQELIQFTTKSFVQNCLYRLNLVMPQWSSLGGYPQVPKSLEALKRAREQDQEQVREQYFMSLLREPTPQNDACLKFCLEKFEPICNLDAMLDLSNPNNERESLVLDVAKTAECMVEVWLDTWIEKAERGERLEWVAVCWNRKNGDPNGDLFY